MPYLYFPKIKFQKFFLWPVTFQNIVTSHKLHRQNPFFITKLRKASVLRIFQFFSYSKMPALLLGFGLLTTLSQAQPHLSRLLLHLHTQIKSRPYGGCGWVWLMSQVSRFCLLHLGVVQTRVSRLIVIYQVRLQHKFCPWADCHPVQLWLRLSYLV